MPTAARSSASACTFFHKAGTWPNHLLKPHCSRVIFGAISAAIIAASTKKVPTPHIGSASAPPSAAIRGQPARINTAAARFSFSGAAPCCRRYPRWCRLWPERSRDRIASPRSRRRCTRRSGLILSTEGRVPSFRRSLSTMASLTFNAPKWVLSMPEPLPLNSTAKLPVDSRCSNQSTSNTPS